MYVLFGIIPTLEFCEGVSLGLLFLNFLCAYVSNEDISTSLMYAMSIKEDQGKFGQTHIECRLMIYCSVIPSVQNAQTVLGMTYLVIT